MQKRKINIGFTGMNQDIPAQNKQAYEIKNLRINATKDGKSLELTSERGTKKVIVQDTSSNNISYYGNILGHAVIGDYIVLFMHNTGQNPDSILRLVPSNTTGVDFDLQCLCVGNLGFGERIETIVSHENNNVMKIYWIDGENLTRVINVAGSLSDIQQRYGVNATDNSISYDPFAFNIDIDKIPTIQVEKQYTGGLFHSGTVQYAVSYWNDNAQETPIIATSPLNYISFEDRGGEVDENIGCNFDITITTNTTRFQHIRVYQIYRSSVDTTPLVKIIRDIDITQSNSPFTTTINDTNQTGQTFDAYVLIIPQTPVVVKAFAYQDRKLFEGNYESENFVLDYDTFLNPNQSNITESAAGWITWSDYKSISYKHNSSSLVYDYINQNNEDLRKIAAFKSHEWYKFGIQFMDKYGNWSNVYPIETSYNSYVPKFSNGNINVHYATLDNLQIKDFIKNKINDHYNDNGVTYNKFKNTYIRVRHVVSFPTVSERSVLCQGIASPTVFNAGQRWNNTCTAQASWFFRPFYEKQWYDVKNGCYVQNENGKPLFSSDTGRGEIQSMYFNSDIPNSQYSNVDEWLHGAFNSGNETYTLYPLGNENVEYKNNHTNWSTNMSNTDKAYRIKESNEEYYFDIYETSDQDDDVRRWIISWQGITDSEGNIVSYNYSISHKISYSLYWYNYNNTTRQPIAFSEIDQSDHDLYKNNYYVSWDFWTVNSPEIEFDSFASNVDLSAYDCRIVGYANYKNTQSSYEIIATNPLFLNTKKGSSDIYYRSQNLAHGFEKVKYGKTGLNGKLMTQRCLWFDDVCNIFTRSDYVYHWNQNSAMYAYSVYPWQRQWLNNYSANRYNPGDASSNHSAAGITEEAETSKILSKILSNQRYCETSYLDTPENSLNPEMKLYNSNQATPIVFNKGDIYYGNVDQVITETSYYYGLYWNNDASYESQTLKHIWKYGLIQGYPLVSKYTFYSKKSSEWPYYDQIIKPYQNTNNTGYDLTQPERLSPMAEVGIGNGKLNVSNDGVTVTPEDVLYSPTPNTSSTDPIVIRYKSTPHIVAKLQNNRSITDSAPYGTVTSPLVEIYKDPPRSYIDNSKDNVLYRDWVPCGKDHSITNETEYLKWTVGDTFVQRYDCLKTYPFSKDDYQSVVEIVSFMVETHINLDGRYDKNRGLDDNTMVTNENFNLINTVYGQRDNFFQYSVIDEKKITQSFPNTIIWSLNKQNGADIDQWTRINTSSFLDFDGDKGVITKLQRWNDQIYVFQEHAVGRVRYNENVALSTDKGVPIELSNSDTVKGKQYLTEHFGSQNKWTVVSGGDGLYFVDKHSPGIYRIGQDRYRNVGVTNIAKDVLQGWVEKNKENISNASYDVNMNELLFEYSDDDTTFSLAHQSLGGGQGVFTAFYDYKGTVCNYNGHSLNILDDELYYLRENNDFNMFYDSKGTKPYWIQFIANPRLEDGMVSDCVFDNVEYVGDVYEGTNTSVDDILFVKDTSNTSMPFRVGNKTGSWYESFDKIQVWNSYQYADSNDGFIKKFRKWRVPIPRQSRSRMRDNWLMVKLLQNNPSTHKFVFKDLSVDAFF